MRWSLPLLCVVALSGCFTSRYVLQAAAGEYELLHVARPIPKVVADQKVERRVRYLLAQVDAIKSWGQARGLTATKNYTRYSDLQRPAAVWVVQGCAPLKFDTRRWSFPIVGTVPYLGFFKEAEARAYGAQLETEEKLDVYVRGAAAFSTLGWFRDPVLSTMIPEGPEALGELANVILHESVHATVYVPDQSSFDESLASFIADGMTRELLVENFGKHAAATRAWEDAQVEYAVRGARLSKAHDALEALYASSVSDDQKLAEKARIVAALQRELRLRRTPNNASLAGARTYSSGKEGFERVRAACATWPRALEAFKTLEGSDFDSPQQEKFDAVLDRLAQRACVN